MKRLVLLGGGHAHVRVLADLADQPLDGWEVHLVSPYRRQIYSGMLPGWIAGHYPIEDCAIALDRLAGRAGITSHETSAIALDMSTQAVHCASGTALPFDLLSIDTGPMPALDALPGAAQHALAVRPIERFIAAWPNLADHIGQASGRFELALLGGGAAGVELAFAIQHRACREGWRALHLALVGSDALPLPGMPHATRLSVMALLAERGIAWHGGHRATGLDAHRLHLENAQALDFDACLVTTGAAAPGWPAASGLATDERGFIRVTPELQCPSHPQVFAAGDVAAYADPCPKSGVYAVRAGPALSRNLRAYCEGRPRTPWRPQPRALYLISSGNRHAWATRGGWSASGTWVWHWKDWIDRRFVRRYAASPPQRSS